ncbi:hypothetical protein AK830_g7664 [Neonectria ditissima]|uniref:Ubiquitin carrier protein n=1 Tax=Neonectria ditissima TaxID=78410 RepID=A0A0P7B9M9_9HYPO|nr:hypothetical protein AK830_g7664 [Neonectria ditissima]
MLSHVAPALVKRAVDFARDTASGSPPDSGAPEASQPPAWIWAIYFADILLLLPILLFCNYTLEKVLPVFAIIEDENPPAYEPVALDDEASGSGSISVRADPIAIGVPKPGNKTASVAVPTRPVVHDAFPITSSFRATLRLLRSHGGVPAYFRAFGCFLFQGLIHSFIAGLFMGVFGKWFSPLGSLIASLLLVQYSTAWVHIVMTPRSPLHFWKRLPAFRFTFEATWRPVLLFWFSSHLAAWSPYLIAVILRFEIPSLSTDHPLNMPATKTDSVKALVTVLLSLVVQLFIVIPAYVSLIRVQASLLPDTQETIIPFDRTFQGKVEPAVITGMGYVSLTDAWTTFSRASWRRLAILYVKVVATSFCVIFFTFLIFGLQWGIIVGFAKGQ